VRIVRRAGEGVAFYAGVTRSDESELDNALAFVDSSGLRWMRRLPDTWVSDVVATDDTLVVASASRGEATHPLGCTGPDTLCITALELESGAELWTRSVPVFEERAQLAVGDGGSAALLFDHWWTTWSLRQRLPDLSSQSEDEHPVFDLEGDFGHDLVFHDETGDLFILTEDRIPRESPELKLRRLMATGEQRWLEAFPGCGTERCDPLSLRLDDAGGLYVRGDAVGEPAPELGAGKALSGGFVVKLGLDGGHRWTRSFSYDLPSRGWSSFGVDEMGYVAFEHMRWKHETAATGGSDLVCLGPDGTTHDTWADLDVRTMALDVSPDGDIAIVADTEDDLDLRTEDATTGPIVVAAIRMAK
jgi:hypothetical protein